MRNICDKHLVHSSPSNNKSLIGNAKPNTCQSFIQGTNEKGSTAYKTLFLGGLKPHLTSATIHNYFSKYGNISDISLKFNPKTGCNKGFAFVSFENTSILEEILKETHYLDGRIVDCKISYGGKHNWNDRRNAARCKIYVKRLSKSVNSSDLEAYFQQFDEVKTAYVIYDPDNQRPRGFGYVQFKNPDKIDHILTLKHEIHGKEIVVTKFILDKKKKDTQISNSTSQSQLNLNGDFDEIINLERRHGNSAKNLNGNDINSQESNSQGSGKIMKPGSNSLGWGMGGGGKLIWVNLG